MRPGLRILVLAFCGSLLACGGQQQYDWEKRFRRDYRQPYDLFVLFELLTATRTPESVLPVRDSLQRFLPDSVDAASYLFVGDMVYLADEEWNALYGWVSQGNTAFLSCTYLPAYLDRTLRMYAGCFTTDDRLYGTALNDSVTLTTDPALAGPPVTASLVHQYRFRPAPTDWSFLNTPYYCELESLTELGYLGDERTNFFRFPHGEGHFYVHLAPEAFTNYHLRDTAVFAYADRCLSILPEGPIYWDEFHKSPYRKSSGDDDERLLRSNHALRYLLNEPPLAAGWYLLVVLAILFVLFRAKRRQAVIPVRSPRRNTSYDYLRDIGQLFYQGSNHRKLATEQRKLFERHLRERYSLSYRNDAAFAEELALRTGITTEQAERIQAELRHLDTDPAAFDAAALLRFYRALEVVYLKD